MRRAFLTLTSSNLATTRDWYVHLLDLRVEFDSDWFVQLQDPDGWVADIRPDPRCPPARAGARLQDITSMGPGRESMSNTTSEPGDGPPRPPRSASVDPWPHEHGEHPSGISVPDGAPARHDHLAHLVGDPVVIHRGDRHHLRRLGWVLAVAIAAAAAVGLAMLL